jgi:hypothetical protein
LADCREDLFCPPALTALHRGTYLPNKTPLAANPPEIESLRKFTAVTQIKHESFGEILTRRSRRIRGDMSFRVVIPLNVCVMMTAESPFEWNAAK